MGNTIDHYSSFMKYKTENFLTDTIFNFLIQQEPLTNDEYSDVKNRISESQVSPTAGVSNSSESAASSSSLTSLIKVRFSLYKTKYF